jgi:hypothetical protein
VDPLKFHKETNVIIDKCNTILCPLALAKTGTCCLTIYRYVVRAPSFIKGTAIQQTEYNLPEDNKSA